MATDFTQATSANKDQPTNPPSKLFAIKLLHVFKFPPTNDKI
jgi:hypothetical protein